MSGTTCYNDCQRVTTNDNEWYKQWQRVVQRMTMNDSEWQRVRTNDNEWLFWQILEPTNRHPKWNPLNFEEDLEEDLLN